MFFHNRLVRNAPFHFHPLHTTRSLVAVLMWLGLMTLFLTTTAR